MRLVVERAIHVTKAIKEVHGADALAATLDDVMTGAAVHALQVSRAHDAATAAEAAANAAVRAVTAAQVVSDAVARSRLIKRTARTAVVVDELVELARQKASTARIKNAAAGLVRAEAEAAATVARQARSSDVDVIAEVELRSLRAAYEADQSELEARLAADEADHISLTLLVVVEESLTATTLACQRLAASQQLFRQWPASGVVGLRRAGARHIVLMAAGLLPLPERSRWYEEWTSQLVELPTRWERAKFSLSLALRAAPELAWILRHKGLDGGRRGDTHDF
ncbi:hypothetical protein [Nonomuraea sediminis]|uniref:hypothetical protein n=1 Tax=Nonomuraea sediminis TaxID=2835864 RepID=UPI001BDD2BF9|nr:hypothetical protein [Nonomuraea sediminis]